MILYLVQYLLFDQNLFFHLFVVIKENFLLFHFFTFFLLIQIYIDSLHNSHLMIFLVLFFIKKIRLNHKFKIFRQSKQFLLFLKLTAIFLCVLKLRSFLILHFKFGPFILKKIIFIKIPFFCRSIHTLLIFY